MIGSYLIFAVLGFILISTFTAHYNQNYLEQYYAAALRRESSQIADSFGNSYYRSELTLEEFQKQIAAVSSYLDADIYIVTTGGRVLITSEQYIRPSVTESIKDFDILDFSGSNYSIGTFYDHYDDDVLTVYTPITRSYKVTCYAIICLPLSHITTLQYDLLNGFYLSLIFLLLLALIILLTFIFAVYRPLQVIIRAARNYADGNFDTALEMDRQDEIGTLADTLHFMALELNALENDQHKFVSNVSHDFRSPLTSIKGYAQAMADGTIPPELQGKYLDVIIFESERLEKLTQSLLELNKYGTKGTYLDLSVFDLNALIKRTLLMFEGRCKEKMVSFHLILTGEELYVKADSAKIDQVMHNLVDNAFKFSHSNSEITIETTLRNGKVFVSVKDQGIGIPKESIGRIWERFYKTDASRGKDKKGTGLGLAIVKEIVHAHHENINVISTEGVGTEFIFTLPYINVDTDFVSVDS